MYKGLEDTLRDGSVYPLLGLLLRHVLLPGVLPRTKQEHSRYRFAIFFTKMKAVGKQI